MKWGCVVFLEMIEKEDFHGKSRILQWRNLYKMDKIIM